jgi:dTDP-4-dehydro-6-deoxy-alpha-D-glucopyranose 2,3-dehydratase
MSNDTVLEARDDTELPGRFARSAAVTSAGIAMRTTDFTAWLADRGRAHRFSVDRIAFADLDGWSFEPDTGNLVHHTGRFFSVEGLHVTVGEGAIQDWQQPIIVQPEIGILGILAKEFDGVLHFLMQAKMEPGNRNLLQLSPTVQATWSNYTKVHGGTDVKYLDYFTRPDTVRVVADVLQSEHGSWFLQKSNRNMIVETDDDVSAGEDFCWLTLGQIGELLRRSNVVNMDARTVLACIPIADTDAAALHSDTDMLSWFTAERSRQDILARRIPLNQVAGWTRGATSIDHIRGEYFQVVAVAVGAGSREVTGWTQPLFKPVETGVSAFVVRQFDGVAHVLVRARVEGGFLDTVELGPTIQCTPKYSAELTAAARPPFLDLVLDADPAQILYEAVHSEEGGRFLNAESRYLFIDADESQAPSQPPAGYQWVTPGQLNFLVRHGHYVNVQARTLLAVINAGAVRF